MKPPEAQYFQSAIVRRLRLYIKHKTYVRIAFHPEKPAYKSSNLLIALNSFHFNDNNYL